MNRFGIIAALFVLAALSYAAFAADAGSSAGPASGITPAPGTGTAITHCGWGITSSGYYYLNGDLTDGESQICIQTQLANSKQTAVIDCRGHTIIGEGSIGSNGNIGIKDQNSNYAGAGNVEIENCRFYNLLEPIVIKLGTATVLNNYISNSYYGILSGDQNTQTGPDSLTIQGNYVSTASNGISLLYSPSVALGQNSICSAPGGWFGPYNIYCQNSQVSGSSQFIATNCGGLQMQSCSIGSSAPA